MLLTQQMVNTCFGYEIVIKTMSRKGFLVKVYLIVLAIKNKNPFKIEQNKNTIQL